MENEQVSINKGVLESIFQNPFVVSKNWIDGWPLVSVESDRHKGWDGNTAYFSGSREAARATRNFQDLVTSFWAMAMSSSAWAGFIILSIR